MNVLLFGATGMVGQGVLRECLLDPDVQLVQIIGRSTSGVQHAKLREIVHADLLDYSSIETALSDFDACFFLSRHLLFQNEGRCLRASDLCAHLGCGNHSVPA